MSGQAFTVTWAMEIPVARDVEDAAVRAFAHIKRENSLATVFFVTAPDGQTSQIDLSDEIETHEVDRIVGLTGCHIIGTPTVYVVPCDTEPAAVFADSDQAEAFAAAKNQGWESESCVIADEEIGRALIAEAQGDQ